jgi:hypothetical protein
MKTAMQELIEHLDIEMKQKGIIPNWDMYLEKEKEQIIDAYEAAMERPIQNYAQVYYNMNYNQNKS